MVGVYHGLKLGKKCIKACRNKYTKKKKCKTENGIARTKSSKIGSTTYNLHVTDFTMESCENETNSVDIFINNGVLQPFCCPDEANISKCKYGY